MYCVCKAAQDKQRICLISCCAPRQCQLLLRVRLMLTLRPSSDCWRGLQMHMASISVRACCVCLCVQHPYAILDVCDQIF